MYSNTFSVFGNNRILRPKCSSLPHGESDDLCTLRTVTWSTGADGELLELAEEVVHGLRRQSQHGRTTTTTTRTDATTAETTGASTKTTTATTTAEKERA